MLAKLTHYLESALAAAGITDKLRPFHDLRHASLTNGAAAGESPIALMARAGHADMRTTKRYLHLAGTVFRDEAAALERRLLGEFTTREASSRRRPLERNRRTGQRPSGGSPSSFPPDS